MRYLIPLLLTTFLFSCKGKEDPAYTKYVTLKDRSWSKVDNNVSGVIHNVGDKTVDRVAIRYNGYSEDDIFGYKLILDTIINVLEEIEPNSKIEYSEHVQVQGTKVNRMLPDSYVVYTK